MIHTDTYVTVCVWFLNVTLFTFSSYASCTTHFSPGLMCLKWPLVIGSHFILQVNKHQWDQQSQYFWHRGVKNGHFSCLSLVWDVQSYPTKCLGTFPGVTKMQIYCSLWHVSMRFTADELKHFALVFISLNKTTTKYIRKWPFFKD